jgi:hypothetical protein
MKSLKAKPAFTLVAIMILIFGFSYKAHSQTVEVFSMRLEASDLLDFRNNNLAVLFTFRKEFVSLFNSKYIAVGKSFPNTSTRKIELKKDSYASINTDKFRGLILVKQTIDDFIADLLNKDLIDLNKPGVAANYDIIFKAENATEGGNNYVGLTIHARKKGDPVSNLSIAQKKINPCPPCTY